MKKLLLITAASTAILSSAAIFAATDPCEGVVMNAPMNDSAMNSSMPSAMENLWYLKVNAGAVIFDSQKDTPTGIKVKSNTGFTGEIGAGYYIMDNLRTDFTIGLVTSNHFKKSANDKDGDRVSVEHRPNIVSFLLNGYVDVVDLNMFKVFAGAGIGAAMVKEKISYTYADATVAAAKNSKVNVKNKTNFAYQLSLGTSFEVAQGVKAELVYSWRDYGKIKTKTITKGSDSARFSGTRYRGNNLMAGLKFDM